MINVRSEDEISSVREAGRIIKATFSELRKAVRPGVKTSALDVLAKEEIEKRGGIAAFKGVKVGRRVYPACICTSINDIVVHGIPSDKAVVRDGDILSIDIGVKLRNFYADAAITLAVGKIDEESAKLVKVTEESLAIGIMNAVAGKRLGDISAGIQRHVESNGFSVVRDLVGHGIGTELWEEPQIPNYGEPGTGPRLVEGMILAIEPMVNAGTFDVETLDDGWAVATVDGKRSAHFEHTIVVREGQAEVLTA